MQSVHRHMEDHCRLSPLSAGVINIRHCYQRTCSIAGLVQALQHLTDNAGHTSLRPYLLAMLCSSSNVENHIPPIAATLLTCKRYHAKNDAVVRTCNSAGPVQALRHLTG
jgi:hypothetical protein